MKPYFLSFFMLLTLSMTINIDKVISDVDKDVVESDVYVCMGPSSKKYHYTKSCRGLSRCSKDIVKVTLSKAKEMKRTLCGWED